MVNNNTAQRLKRVEERLARVSEELTTTIHADQILLMHVERVASHCTQAIKKLHAIDSRQCTEDELSRISDNYDIVNQEILNMTSDRDLFRATSESTATTTSVLLARELFPSEESPTKSSRSSSSTPDRTSRQAGNNNVINNFQGRLRDQSRY